MTSPESSVPSRNISLLVNELCEGRYTADEFMHVLNELVAKPAVASVLEPIEKPDSIIRAELGLRRLQRL